MQITKLRVTAGRTLPHPCESYANLRPELSIEADLIEGDDPNECRKQLQVMAERAVEEHAASLVASLQQRQVIEREADDIRKLERGLIDSQARLENMKEERASRMAQSEAGLLF